MNISLQPCFIVCNGPSLSDLDLSLIDGYFSIGVNRSFLAVETTCLLWQDQSLIRSHGKEIEALDCIRIARSKGMGGKPHFLFRASSDGWDYPISPLSLKAGSRPSSGSLAVCMAGALGFSPIVLLGADCKYMPSPDGTLKTDFYGRNEKHGSHTLKKCVEGLEATRKLYRERVLSCGLNEVYPKRELLEVVGGLTAPRMPSEFWRQWLTERLKQESQK